MSKCKKCQGDFLGSIGTNVDHKPVTGGLPEMTQCTLCKEYYSREYTCSVCSGSGWIEDSELSMPQYGDKYCSECGSALMERKTYQCPKCHGSGKIYNHHTCKSGPLSLLR